MTSPASSRRRSSLSSASRESHGTTTSAPGTTTRTWFTRPAPAESGMSLSLGSRSRQRQVGETDGPISYHAVAWDASPVSPTRISRFGVLALAAAATACALAGCSGKKRKAESPAGLVASTAARDRWGTVWLCRPGERDNPCLSDLTTTIVGPHQTTRLERAVPAANPPIDCFYVYPTISGERTINADLTIGFRERAVALTQAARFSQVCRVYAPVYRQITLSALNHPGRIRLRHELIAYRSLPEASRTYLAHYNEGRGIAFIGHSQGVVLLIRLLQHHLDGSPSLRRRLVSALLLGGNVTVARGRNARGDFRHIPACASQRE